MDAFGNPITSFCIEDDHESPDVIATSCPYCKIMLGSAVNEKGVNDSVQVMDVMELVSSRSRVRTVRTLGK